MRLHWTTAALFSAALIAGCNGRGNENSQTSEQVQPGAPAPADTTAAAPETAPSSAGVNNSAAGDDRPVTSGSRPTTGARPAARPAAPAGSTNDTFNTRPSAAAPAAAPQPPRPRYRELNVPAGTSLPLELMTAVSSATAQVETPVRARLKQAVTIDGYTAIPAGTVLSGNVAEVARAGRVQGRSRLVLRFTEAEVNGVRENVRTNPITFEGEATKGEDATKVGVGAGVGAAIGGLLGGGKGAAKGAAIGGAGGAGVVLATRGKEVELASGADIDASLATPVDIQVEIR